MVLVSGFGDQAGEDVESKIQLLGAYHCPGQTSPVPDLCRFSEILDISRFGIEFMFSGYSLPVYRRKCGKSLNASQVLLGIFVSAGCALSASPMAALSEGTSEELGSTPSIASFGSPLDSSDQTGPSCPSGCNDHPLSEWPAPARPTHDTVPLKGKGPYENGMGEKWVARINDWYQKGTAAGLAQDTFRSFDNGHSGLGMSAFPQMNIKSPVPRYDAACDHIFKPRVTMGVQSYGVTRNSKMQIQGRCIIEHISQSIIRASYSSKKATPIPTKSFFRAFYENNFLFAAPAVGTFTPARDGFSFLCPFYLHSIGASGTDARLLTPLVYASAALPSDLKTRIMRQGLYVPTMMYLFKSHITGDIKSPAAHVPAYALPAEAAADYRGATPFLDGLVTAAHELTHVPPVARLKLSDVTVEDTHGYRNGPYYADFVYSFVAALRRGESLILTVDLGRSWLDRNQSVASYYAKRLRGKGKIERLNAEGSRLRVTVPWSPSPKTHDYRTDFLFLINDGTYYSAPAYISVRHIHALDPLILGIRAR